MTSYVFSVVNESDRQLALIFYLDPQLIPAGRERVEVPANSEVRLLDIIASQASGPITFVPAEFGGGRGTYDSLAVETPTGRSVLTPLACDDPRNALCIGNYQRAETRNLIRYTLFLEE